jgi:hypothetical protein
MSFEDFTYSRTSMGPPIGAMCRRPAGGPAIAPHSGADSLFRGCGTDFPINYLAPGTVHASWDRGLKVYQRGGSRPAFYNYRHATPLYWNIPQASTV